MKLYKNSRLFLLLILRKYLFYFSVIISITNATDSYKIDHLEPPFWWAGMVDDHLQIMVHGQHISELNPEISYPGISII